MSCTTHPLLTEDKLVFKKMYTTDKTLHRLIPIEDECFKGMGWDFYTYRKEVDEARVCVLYGAFGNNELVGCTMAICTSKGVWHIVTLMVLGVYRKRGIAKKLMVLLTKELRKRKTNKLASMVLEVSTKNKVAYNIYKKMGFVKLSIVRDFYPWGDDAYSMVRQYR